MRRRRGSCTRCHENERSCARWRGPFSPEFAHASELIGRRWTGAVIWALFHDVRRFSEIADTIPGISRNMLAERLRELERTTQLQVRRVGRLPTHSAALGARSRLASTEFVPR